MSDFGETATAVEEVAIGAAKSVAEVASNPARTVRTQVRSLERKGTPAVRRINRRINAMLPDRIAVFGVEVDQRFPEKLAIKGLHAMRGQARRDDVFGGVAKRTLGLFHGSFKTIARTATRLEEASQLTPRAKADARPSPAVRRARRRTARRRAA